MKVQPSPNVLRTDFNSLSENGLVDAARALARVTWGSLDAGMLVELLDGEGNTCQGVIVSTSPRAVCVRPIWGTWQASPVVVWSKLPAQVVVERPFIELQPSFQLSA